MKRVAIITLTFGICSAIWSQNVSERYAATTAQKYLQLVHNRLYNIDDVVAHFSNDTLCFYYVFFDDDKFCIVSAYRTTPPVLAHGTNYSGSELGDNENYHLLINTYEKQLKKVASQNDNALAHNLWDSLSVPNSASVAHQVPSILDDARNEPLKWGQRGNNTNILDCSPAYNQECPWVPFIECNKGYAGCGPVAMGQIMWYWQWPRSSEYRIYHWEHMPAAITCLTDDSKAESIAQLLLDCGMAANAIYADPGTATEIQYLFPALRDDFGYNGILLHRKIFWQYKNAWEDLLKSELDNNRPVIYYGDDGSEFDGHYFIIDGYEKLFGQTLYHVNWGHRGNNNGYFTLDNFVENGNEYLMNNNAIVGISPTYNEHDIYSLNYSIIGANHNRKEYAQNNISVPATSNTLTIEDGGELLLEAGGEIEILPGFEAKKGSEVEVRINDAWQSNMAISLIDYPSAFSVGSALSISTKNADSWEFTIGKYGIYDNNVVFIPMIESAGSIRDDNPIIWDGGEVLDGAYYCWITLKNSFGRVLLNLFEISSDGEMNYLNTGAQAYQNSTQMQNVSSQMMPDNDSVDIIIHPNPSYGVFEIELQGDIIISIDVYNPQGQCIYVDNNIVNNHYVLNISSFRKGNYIIYIRGNINSYQKSIIKQ